MNGNRIVITLDQLNAVKKEFKKLRQGGLGHTTAFDRALVSILPEYVCSTPVSEYLLLKGNPRKLAFYFNTGDTYDVTIILYATVKRDCSVSCQLRLGCWGDLVESGRYGVGI